METAKANGPVLGELDLHLWNEGRHWTIYEKLGAHLAEEGGKEGVRFSVWAPSAGGVSVVGDFNGWQGGKSRLEQQGVSGIWTAFVPGVAQGAAYKYEIQPRHGGPAVQKVDPFAFYAEVPPKSASIVWGIEGYNWRDGDWMKRRAESDPLHKPINVYEVHLDSWRKVPEEGNRPLGYRELAHELVDYCAGMGYTHIELMPITEHPFTGSWGYQTTGYFGPTSRYGTPQDFMYFVDRCHQAGLGVILDWVPAHFPTDGHGLARFDGTALFEHEDPRQGFHPDWGTYIFNYGRHEIRNFLLASALFWLKKYHLDGLRLDAVASMLYLDYSRKQGEWIPNRFGGRENLEAVGFLKEFNALTHRDFPGILTIAEESTAWPMVSRPVHLGGLGFSLKWNMGWMHDMLVYISKEPIHRKYHHYDATFSMIYAYTENFMLVLSHDEVVHGKRAMLDKFPGDGWQKFAGLRGFYGFMFGHPGKKLTFMGAEMGQWKEWDWKNSLDWHLLKEPLHGKLNEYVKALNLLYKNEPALWTADFDSKGFEWIDCNDTDNSVFSFVRYSADRQDALVFVTNFTPVVRESYRIGLPSPGRYDEVLNSDSELFGGSNVGNAGGRDAEDQPWHGRSHSTVVTVPPLATVVFKRRR
ncbi:MAG: 1,4-alpha-glucan branching protein GlgB [Elusimicrobia bacterium]|nr:1,4-alpha-glucan branching protein GlgB [Elusimicrobiota bacterium]